MDTADGMLSGAPRERALEIMKDSNVGAMGVLGAVLLHRAQGAALGALTRADAAAPAARRLVRGARAAGARRVPAGPTRAPPAPARRSRASASPGPVQLAGGLLAAGVVVAGLAGLAAGAAGSWYAGLVTALVAMAVALLVQAAVAKRLGGLTGDVYGIGIELAEAAALVAGCAIVRLAG